MRKLHITIVLVFICLIAKAQQANPLVSDDAQQQSKWVDSVYTKMTADEKIGQLFMVMVFSNQIGTANTEAVKEQIKKYNIGGIIFSKGGA